MWLPDTQQLLTYRNFMTGFTVTFSALLCYIPVQSLALPRLNIEGCAAPSWSLGSNEFLEGTTMRVLHTVFMLGVKVIQEYQQQKRCGCIKTHGSQNNRMAQVGRDIRDHLL